MRFKQSTDRRTLLKTSSIVATGGLTAIAGCIGSNNEPPPRKSNVIDDIELSADGTALRIDPFGESNRWVVSRRDLDVDASAQPTNQTRDSGSTASLSALSKLSPVGTARAAKGRGATGRGSGGYSSAPRTANGRAWFWGGSYTNGWYNDHDDEVSQYPVDIATLGIAYIGPNARFEEQDPGPGPINWDDTYDSPTDTEIETSIEDVQPGWYRVGANIVVAEGPDEGADLGWECIDLRLEQTADGKEITERWKVSPRI